MIDLYYWTTPNGHKVTIFLEETGLPVPPEADEHLARARSSTRHSSRSRPTIAFPRSSTTTPPDGGAPLSLFESGAILLYLAEQDRPLLSARPARALRGVAVAVLADGAGSGRWPGQNHHFSLYAPEKIPYAIDRYVRETGRLYGVLNKRLADREFVAGDYSIADMACYPWVLPERQGQNLERLSAPEAMEGGDRRAAGRAARLRDREGVNQQPGIRDDKSRAVLFGQDRSTVAEATSRAGSTAARSRLGARSHAVGFHEGRLLG